MLLFLLGINMGISSVTSEALQLKLRQLLPSQQGFGTDLSASDTIIPIIDLTQAAEGSDVGESLQQALAFGSQTTFSANNNTVTLASSPGFYRLTATSTLISSGSGGVDNIISMDDGSATKNVWIHSIATSSTTVSSTLNVDYVFFLTAGITLKAISNNAIAFLRGSYRQIADTNGSLVNPVGFSPQ
jgi:hypothetical protein